MLDSIEDLYWSNLQQARCIPSYDVNPLEFLIEKESRSELFETLVNLSFEELQSIVESCKLTHLSYYKRNQLHQRSLKKIQRKLKIDFDWGNNCDWNLGDI